MAIEYDRERIKQERDYAREENALNRQHVLSMKDKEIELEKWKFEKIKYMNPLKEILKFPVRLVMIFPLCVAIIRKHRVSEILEMLK